MKVLVVESDLVLELSSRRSPFAGADDWTLSHRDLPLDATRADVRRHDGGLQVTLFVPAETPKVVRDMAVVRVAGALRAFDAHSSRIDVAYEVKA